MRKRSSLKVAAGYAAFAALWIVATSGVYPWLSGSWGRAAGLELGKGLVFVLITAGILYLLLRRNRSEESQRYQLLLAEHPQPMLLVDPENGRLVDVNPAAVRFYGWPRAVLTRMRIVDFGELDEDAVRQALGRLRSREQSRFELRQRVAIGEWRDVEVFGGPSRVADRELLYLVVVDITVRRRALAELEERERRFSSLFEHAQSGIAVLAAIRDAGGALVDFEVVDTNQAVRHHVDFDPEAIRGRRWTELLPGGRTSPGFMQTAAVADSGRADSYEMEVPGRHLRVNAYLIEADCVVVVFTDIGARHRAERALRASEARYRELFEHNPQPMWVFERQTLRILSVNDAAVAKYGYSREEFLAMTIEDICPPEDLARLRQFLDQGEAGLAQPGPWRHLRKDGGLMDVEIASHDLDWEGRPARLVLIHEVTERVRAEAALRESEERLHLALTGANDGWWDWDLENDHLYYSPRWWTILGYAVNELPADASLWRRLTCAEDLPEAERVIRQTLESGGRRYEVECRMRHRNGRLVPILSSGLVTYDAHGKPVRITGTNTDLTAFRRLDEQRRMTERLFRSAGEGMTITDLEGNIVDVNPAFEAITGYSRDQVLGKNPRILQSSRQDAEFYRRMWRTLNETGQWRGELWNRRKNGEVYLQWLTVSAVTDAKGQTTHYLGIFSDLSEVRAAREEAQFVSRHDPLTGLPNRTVLVERIQSGIARARRLDAPLMVAMIGLDRLGAINEGLGHGISDQYLAGVARRLAGTVREVDTLARFAENRFVLVAEETLLVDEIDRLLRRVLANLEMPLEIAGHRLVPGASIGVALFPGDGERHDVLLRNAELAMDEARRAGGGRFAYFSHELGEDAVARLRLESALRGALGRGEFELHYQPQVALDSGKVVAVEALLRWRSAQLGAVPPGRFIPVAEELGLMPETGRWVLDEACRQLAAWRRAGVHVPRIAVNLSLQQLDDSNLVEMVAGTLRRHDLPAGALELELTESMVMRKPDQAQVVLAALREVGVELALDDFGTGYSSLANLGSLPLNRLKIDRSFVAGIGTAAQSEAIVQAVIGLGRVLGLETVAEGVETDAQAAFLRRQGCRIAQGYLMARPMPAAELAAWVERPASRRAG